MEKVRYDYNFSRQVVQVIYNDRNPDRSEIRMLGA